MMPRWNHVLVYAPAADSPWLFDRLREVMEGLGVIESIEICKTTKGLGERLRQAQGRPGIVILVPYCRDDMGDLLSMASLLDGLRIVVVLPDREADTVTKGHALRPRFLTYSDSSPADIGAVLKKMCNGAQS